MRPTQGSKRHRSWGIETSRLVRALASREYSATLSQVKLAELLGVSQPRISQILALLREAGVEACTDSPSVRLKLIDLYVEHHRPAQAVRTFWFRLDSQRDQIERIAALARRRRIKMTVSADFAPDVLRAWRVPTRTAVYVHSSTDPSFLDRADFVRAPALGESSIVVVQTPDESLLVPWATRRTSVPLAHPVQQIWDLVNFGGVDRMEAAEHLKAAIIKGEL